MEVTTCMDRLVTRRLDNNDYIPEGKSLDRFLEFGRNNTSY